MLRARRIPFAVIGAAAMAVHGVSRSTRDLDLLAVSPTCLDPATWEPLGPQGATFVVRRGASDDPLAGVVRFDAAAEPPVDLVVGRHAWQAEILERARETPLAEDRVPVARPADVVLLKLYAGGPQDAWDVEQLLAVPERGALVAEIEAVLSALPEDARRLWARIRSGARA